MTHDALRALARHAHLIVCGPGTHTNNGVRSCTNTTQSILKTLTLLEGPTVFRIQDAGCFDGCLPFSVFTAKYTERTVQPVAPRDSELICHGMHWYATLAATALRCHANAMPRGIKCSQMNRGVCSARGGQTVARP